MTTLNEYIDQHFDPDPDVTASAAFDAMGLPDKWRTMFYGVVRDECRRQARTIVRNHERGSSDELDTQPTTMSSETMTRASAACRVNERTIWLNDRMYCGLHFGYAVKGDATAEQWEARAVYLASQMDGIARTRDECVEVAKFLRDAGVDCLAALEAVTS